MGRDGCGVAGQIKAGAWRGGMEWGGLGPVGQAGGFWQKCKEVWRGVVAWRGGWGVAWRGGRGGVGWRRGTSRLGAVMSCYGAGLGGEGPGGAFGAFGAGRGERRGPG